MAAKGPWRWLTKILTLIAAALEHVADQDVAMPNQAKLYDY
jgi:hypothetical protein